MDEGEMNNEVERAHRLMMGALDGEISDAERTELRRLMEQDPSLQGEWKRLNEVKEVTGTMALRSPPAEVWETYWTSVYHRFERGVGWILLSLGAIVSLSYGLWQVVQEVIADTAIPVAIKAAIFVTMVGTVILFVSVAREKWFIYRSDPYKDVQR